jgi:ribosome-associated protein
LSLSKTQVSAIADACEFIVKKTTKEIPYRKEGFQNSEWIIIDYSSVVVHVFQSEIREFYNIEALWADAEITVLK